MINYRTIAAEGTFIRQYMEAMDGLETAHSYDFWCACSVLGAVLGRSVYVDRPRLPVRFNWFIILAADSGITRKSTAVVHARKLAAPLLQETPGAVLIETKTTPEKLTYMLERASEEQGHAYGHILVSELVTFLGRERYTMQMPALLTDLYDCPDARTDGGVLSRRSFVLRNVFVTFLSASTPAWLMRAINPDVIEGGFTSRCIFIVDERRKRAVAWPSDVGDNADFSVLHRTLRRLRAEAQTHGAIPLTRAAVERFKRWYSRRVMSRDPYRVSFEAREDEHVLRLAGTLAINDELYKIEVRHITAAIKVIEEAKRGGAALFAGGVVPDRILTGIDKLRTVLIEAGIDGLPQNELYRRVRSVLDNNEFRTLIDLMHEHKMVQRFEFASTATAKRKALIWRATQHIREKGRLDSVLAGLQPSA